MTTPYLILHKVRGRLEYDVALRTSIGGKEAWIVGSSGHRAYPFACWNLSELEWEGEHVIAVSVDPTEFELRPDHYTPTITERFRPKASSILDLLGLKSKSTPIPRRKLP